MTKPMVAALGEETIPSHEVSNFLQTANLFVGLYFRCIFMNVEFVFSLTLGLG